MEHHLPVAGRPARSRPLPARARLLPEVRPSYAGYVAWRGTVPERALPAATRERFADAITYQVLKDSHILVYPIPGLDGALTGVAEPFVQVVYDIAVPRMAFGRVGLIGDGPGN